MTRRTTGVLFRLEFDRIINPENRYGGFGRESNALDLAQCGLQDSSLDAVTYFPVEEIQSSESQLVLARVGLSEVMMSS